VVPVVVLDVKIYGQWFTKGKRFLSAVANPTSQLSVIGNLVGARAAAEIGWRESAVCMFSLGMAHYLVLFVTLYQRLSGGNSPSSSCSLQLQVWQAWLGTPFPEVLITRKDALLSVSLPLLIPGNIYMKQ
jgi:hypothetical protein